MRVAVIVQARLGSTRLPGKVLLPLAGRSLLAHVIERAGQARLVHEVRVATTDAADDRAVAAEAERAGASVSFGSECDVLSRTALAARDCEADLVVRVTSDCPLLAPELIDRAVEQIAREGVDYVSNTRQRSFPHGLDVEVIARSALEVAEREATSASDREHVTPYVWGRPERFALASLPARADERAPEFRVTVDRAEDYALVCAVAQLLPPDDPAARTLVRVLRRHPWLRRVNERVEQKPVFGGSEPEQNLRAHVHAARWCLAGDLAGPAESLLDAAVEIAGLDAAVLSAEALEELEALRQKLSA